MLVKKRASGFTLIELMMVLAVVGILSAIAYPSYTTFVQKAARTQAKTILNTISQRQSIYFITNRTYDALNSGTAPLDYSAATISIDKDGNLGAAGAGLYDITMFPASTSFAYTIRAVATKAQLKDTDCRVFTLNGTGVQAALSSTGTDNSDRCW